MTSCGELAKITAEWVLIQPLAGKNNILKRIFLIVL
jgi:hypothetical protein